MKPGRAQEDGSGTGTQMGHANLKVPMATDPVEGKPVVALSQLPQALQVTQLERVEERSSISKSEAE